MPTPCIINERHEGFWGGGAVKEQKRKRQRERSTGVGWGEGREGTFTRVHPEPGTKVSFVWAEPRSQIEQIREETPNFSN